MLSNLTFSAKSRLHRDHQRGGARLSGGRLWKVRRSREGSEERGQLTPIVERLNLSGECWLNLARDAGAPAFPPCRGNSRAADERSPEARLPEDARHRPR